MSLSQDVSTLPGVGPKTAEKLAAAGLETIEDLLYFFPRKFEDRSQRVNVRDLSATNPPEGKVTVLGEVRSAAVKFMGRKRVFDVVLVDNGAEVVCRFFRFSQKAMEGRFRPGKYFEAFGAVSFFRNTAQMVHPDLQEPAEEGTSPVVPVYGEVAGIAPKTLRKAVQSAAERFGHLLEDHFDDALRTRCKIAGLREVIRDAHLPEAGGDALYTLSQVTRRLAFDELLFFQWSLIHERERVASVPGIVHAAAAKPDVLRALAANFPFDLTDAQAGALQSIASDLAAPRPMRRLLQGDVGSGKTAVAMGTAWMAVESGYQVALLAPTDVLARQLHKKAEQFFGEGLRVDLLVGASRAAQRRDILEATQLGTSNVLVGTHALLEPTVVFKNLGLAIIDEQHRFGVEQRAKLHEKAAGSRAADLLVMTATPIPRTLSLVLYGDLEVTVIDSLPPGRSPIQTSLLGRNNPEPVFAAVEEAFAREEQVYVVYPLVETSEKLDLASAEDGFQKWQKRFPGVPMGLLHGKLRPADKADVMQQFREGALRMLVSTTVIEVGVDVPNATLIVVTGAERFGLSQLHQLRGRVGRGDKPGRCVLVTGAKPGSEAWERLQVLVEHTSGFRIAEKDLEIRGAGDVLGTRQHGVAEFAHARIPEHAELLEAARAEVERLVTAEAQGEPIPPALDRARRRMGVLTGRDLQLS